MRVMGVLGLPPPGAPLPKAPLLQAPRPSTGPHKLRECLPLIIFLRNRLKYALTGDEVKKICMQRFIKIDGKVRTDITYPAGFMGERGGLVQVPRAMVGGMSCGASGIWGHGAFLVTASVIQLSSDLFKRELCADCWIK